jgi:hypothetical protein
MKSGGSKSSEGATVLCDQLRSCLRKLAEVMVREVSALLHPSDGASEEIIVRILWLLEQLLHRLSTRVSAQKISVCR